MCVLNFFICTVSLKVTESSCQRSNGGGGSFEINVWEEEEKSGGGRERERESGDVLFCRRVG